MTKQTGYKEGIQLGGHFTEWPGGCRMQDAVDTNLRLMEKWECW